MGCSISCRYHVDEISRSGNRKEDPECEIITGKRPKPRVGRNMRSWATTIYDSTLYLDTLLARLLLCWCSTLVESDHDLTCLSHALELWSFRLHIEHLETGLDLGLSLMWEMDRRIGEPGASAQGQGREPGDLGSWQSHILMLKKAYTNELDIGWLKQTFCMIDSPTRSQLTYLYSCHCAYPTLI